MNYELAKKLKEAGFPQPLDEWNGNYLDKNSEWTGALNEGAVYAPTLEELIEACSPLSLDGTSGRRWVAMTFVYPQHISRSGLTPPEAVARLWLALNERTG